MGLYRFEGRLSWQPAFFAKVQLLLLMVIPASKSVPEEISSFNVLHHGLRLRLSIDRFQRIDGIFVLWVNLQ